MIKRTRNRLSEFGWLQDHRWRSVWELGEWLTTTEDDAVSPELERRMRRYLAALEAIAADHTQSAEQRELAHEMLAEFADGCYEHLTNALNALAEANMPRANPNEDEGARADLQSQIAHVHEIINDPLTPDGVRLQAIRGLRGILS